MLEKVKRFFSRIGSGIKMAAVKVLSAFDIRDCLVFGGVAMLGYGLWLLRPWLGWAASGLILFTLGLLWPVFLSLTAQRGR